MKKTKTSRKDNQLLVMLANVKKVETPWCLMDFNEKDNKERSFSTSKNIPYIVLVY